MKRDTYILTSFRYPTSCVCLRDNCVIHCVLHYVTIMSIVDFAQIYKSPGKFLDRTAL